jgi:adenylylsulfate kinase
MIYWFTGQPGAGKTTLSNLMASSSIMNIVNVDGDDIREIFNNKDYSEIGRRKNVELAQNIAHFLNNKGFTAIVSLVSPYREQREEFKNKMGKDIVELYVHTDEIRGREERFVENYEKPLDNFIDVNTSGMTPYETYNEILKKIKI